MNLQKDLVIVGGARTAMTEYSGTPGYGLCADTGANQLGAHAITAALERAGVEDEGVGLGNLVYYVRGQRRGTVECTVDTLGQCRGRDDDWIDVEAVECAQVVEGSRGQRVRGRHRYAFLVGVYRKNPVAPAVSDRERFEHLGL